MPKQLTSDEQRWASRAGECFDASTAAGDFIAGLVELGALYPGDYQLWRRRRGGDGDTALGDWQRIDAGHPIGQYQSLSVAPAG